MAALKQYQSTNFSCYDYHFKVWGAEGMTNKEMVLNEIVVLLIRSNLLQK